MARTTLPKKEVEDLEKKRVEHLKKREKEDAGERIEHRKKLREQLKDY